MDRLQRRTATFIIRLWMEYLDEDPPIYRGEVESVMSGHKIPFVDLATLMAFLQEQVGPKTKTSEVE